MLILIFLVFISWFFDFLLNVVLHTIWTGLIWLIHDVVLHVFDAVFYAGDEPLKLPFYVKLMVIIKFENKKNK
ncbi:Uncharacterised protein [Acinetobacter baumannii]|nr:Uncharacterised protein [Acinetobacter baumannii]